MARPVALLALLLGLAICGSAFAAYEKEKKFWVWPKPVNSSIGDASAWLDESNFVIKLAPGSFEHDILTSACSRFAKSIAQNHGEMVIIDYPQLPPKPTAPSSSQIKVLTLNVLTSASSLDFGVDESYSLSVTATTAAITAQTMFGALHALETFSQLVQWNGTVHLVPYVPISVTDYPAWSWRGMLVDTSRHYQSIANLEAIIDSLALAKLNVFHWHLTDAESFPVELPTVPEFANKGAWSSRAVYSVQDVQHIVQYALYRGVRVVPEIDTPGHTYSFGKSHPEMIVNCTGDIAKRATFPAINDVCLNMTNPGMYPLLDKIYGDLATLFADAYIHVGGDEVQSSCLNEFPFFKSWMYEHGMDNSTYSPLLCYFRKQLTPMITTRNKKMVVWQEALEEMLPLGAANPLTPNNTMVQLWIKDGYQSVLNASLQRGYPTLMSGGWYLDQQVPKPNPYVPGTDDDYIYSSAVHYLAIDTWQDMYNVDPLKGLDLTPAQVALFQGGEVAQWAEAVMGLGILTNIWPRAAAGAERLWRGSGNIGNIPQAYHRLIRFQCYLYQRGVPASGIQPSYCTSSILDPAPAPVYNPAQPPYFHAGGLTIAMPVWALIIVCAVALVLLIATLALSWHVYQKSKQEKDGYAPLNHDN